MANILKGKIISLKQNKTAVVEIEKYFTHPLYKKRIRRTKKYQADYHGTNLHEGDIVSITESRPQSKEKHFKVMLGHSSQHHPNPEIKSAEGS